MYLMFTVSLPPSAIKKSYSSNVYIFKNHLIGSTLHICLISHLSQIRNIAICINILAELCLQTFMLTLMDHL